MLIHNNSQNYIFPEKYRTTSYQVEVNLQHSKNSINQKNCNTSSVESRCGDFTYDSFAGIHIYSPSVYLSYLGGTREALIHSKNPLFGYQQGAIIQHGPLASLDRNYTLYFTFDSEVFTLDDIATKIQLDFFCNATGSNIEHKGFIDSTNSMHCTIPYFGIDEISVDINLRIPGISNESVILNRNSITGYFINQGNISFTKASQVQFFYSSVNTDPVFITFNGSIPKSLLSQIKCYSGVIASTTLISNYNNESYVFECIFNIDKAQSGLKSIGLQFIDGNYHPAPFLVSSNGLNMTFVGKIKFNF